MKKLAVRIHTRGHETVGITLTYPNGREQHFSRLYLEDGIQCILDFYRREEKPRYGELVATTVRDRV